MNSFHIVCRDWTAWLAAVGVISTAKSRSLLVTARPRAQEFTTRIVSTWACAEKNSLAVSATSRWISVGNRSGEFISWSAALDEPVPMAFSSLRRLLPKENRLAVARGKRNQRSECFRAGVYHVVFDLGRNADGHARLQQDGTAIELCRPWPEITYNTSSQLGW